MQLLLTIKNKKLNHFGLKFCVLFVKIVYIKEQYTVANKVLDYFYQIMSIPRESGNESAMVEFLKNFAIKNNLEYVVDNHKNVLIKKKTGTQKPLILQAHTDMVCVANKPFDFATNPITPVVEGNTLRADGTSLGADNGIGLCMILALLEEDFPMNIEAVFTSEEETTMNGAQNFDHDLLCAKHFISLDGSQESVIEIGSASVIKTVFNMPVSLVADVKDNLFSVSVSGLIGGHSGQDIDKNRGHAFKILFGFLNQLEDVKLVSLQAEEKDNVIPTQAKAVFETKQTKEQIEQVLEDYFFKVYNSCYAPKLKIEVAREQNLPGTHKAYLNSAKLLKFLKQLQYGVVEEDTDGSVLVSANLHHVDLKNSKIHLSIRGASKSLERKYVFSLQMLAKAFEFEFKPISYLPGFEQKQDGYLQQLLVKTHEQVYGTQPTVQKIHAGLEAAIFAEKMPDLEICVIAPNIYDLHSVSERVDLESVDRTYQWLKNIVKQF